MMPELSRRVLEAPSSATVRIADLASTLRHRGHDVLDFSAGRASEHTPPYICEAASKAIHGGDTHQTMAQGKPEFREACARKLKRENRLELNPEDEIIASMGCKQGLMLALMAILNPGDEIIVEDPGFVSYQPTVRFCGGVPIPVPLNVDNGFRWRPWQLEEAITEKTRALLFCSPQNPTGVVHSAEDLDVIAEFANRHNLVVIADETYERIAWGHQTHTCIATLPGMRERTIGLMGVTKSFSMGGWRIGFVYAKPDFISGMVTLQQHLMTCAGSFAQTGAALALGEPVPPSVNALWTDWEARCRFVTAEIDAIPGISCGMPEGGFYAWIDVSNLGIGSEAIADRLLRDQHIALVPGAAFGEAGEGYLRMTCVKSWDDVKRGVTRLRVGLENSQV